MAKLSFFTPIKNLLKTCGWMSVRQLMAYHSMILLHKTLATKAPKYLYDKVSAGGRFSYSTRQAAVCPSDFSFSVQHPTDNGAIRQTRGHKLTAMSKEGWCWKSVETFNTIPTELRLERRLSKFKTRLKDWVEKNIEI